MIPGLYPFARKWAEKGSVYIISDPHFDDSDCKLMDPDWPEPGIYIEKLNKSLTRNDTLICLGDCGDPSYFAKLKAGYKVLVKGNHDKGNSNYSPYFDEIYEGPVFISEKIVLSHEPIPLGDIAISIHGHQHNLDSPENYNEINLAANYVNYEMANLGKLVKTGINKTVDGIHRLTIDKASEGKR